MPVLYLDSSALVKLVVAEAESEPLIDALRDWPLRATSIVAAVELPRAARRGSDRPAVARRANDLVSAITLIELDREVAGVAAGLTPLALRSLDAIHLASALSIGSDLGAIVTYDARLSEAATAAKLTVLAPS